MFNWGIERELVDKNPVAAIDKPGPTTRGADSLISEKQHQALLRVANPSLANFLMALWDSGARPGEISRVSSACFDSSLKAWVLRDHKTYRKTQRYRVIPLTDDNVDIFCPTNNSVMS